MDLNHTLHPASPQDFLITLASVDSVLIRASVAQNTIETYLRDITFYTAVDNYNGQSRALHVELCKCPAGYNGSSCETCASGYYKDLHHDYSTPLGSCLRCPCNNREASCEMGGDTRVICHCLPNYSGPNCKNESKYLIDQLTSICPLKNKSNNAKLIFLLYFVHQGIHFQVFYFFINNKAVEIFPNLCYGSG